MKEDQLWLGGGAYPPHSLMSLKLDGRGVDTKPQLLWKTRRGTPSCVSPVLYQGKLYVLSDSGVMTCFDPVDGKRIWAERIPRRGRFYASLVAGDGKIYAISEGGLVSVIEAGDEFRLLASHDMGHKVYASPAVADGCLLIRTAESLYCIDGVSSALSLNDRQ